MKQEELIWEFVSNSIFVQFDGHREAEVSLEYFTNYSEVMEMIKIKITFHSTQMDYQTRL